MFLIPYSKWKLLKYICICSSPNPWTQKPWNDIGIQEIWKNCAFRTSNPTLNFVFERALIHIFTPIFGTLTKCNTDIRHYNSIKAVEWSITEKQQLYQIGFKLFKPLLHYNILLFYWWKTTVSPQQSLICCVHVMQSPTHSSWLEYRVQYHLEKVQNKVSQSQTRCLPDI